MANNIQYDQNVQQAVDSALAEQKKKKKKKKLIIFVVLAIVVVGVVAMATSGGDDSSSTANTTTAKVSDTSDTSQAEAVDEKIKAGTVVNDGDMEITYVSCNANYTDYNEYCAPEKGNKIVRAEFSFKNNGTSDHSLNFFECYADGQKCDEYYSADDYSSPALESISAGRTLKGIVYFEVPASAEEIELEYETNFWSSKKMIFVIK